MSTGWTRRLITWRGRWQRATLPVLLALVVSSGAAVTPASAAGIRTAQPDAVRGRQHECIDVHEDPCVYLIRMDSIGVTIGLEPGFHSLNDLRSNEYHVRWSVGGGPEKSDTVWPTTKTSETFWVGKNADDFRTYRFAVQRCAKVAIGKDDCTGWTVRSYGGTETGIEITPNPNAAGNGIETKPNPRTKQDNGIETKPKSNARR